MKFSSKRREMLSFLTTNMAAVTSRANQQLVTPNRPTMQFDVIRMSKMIAKGKYRDLLKNSLI